MDRHARVGGAVASGSAPFQGLLKHGAQIQARQLGATGQGPHAGQA